MTGIDLHVERAIGRVKARLFGGVARPVTIARFEIVGVLGQGGMGVVYEAVDPALGRRVALKLVGAGERSERTRARLLQEARTIARLCHPNIVTIYDVGSVGDEVYIAMELVDGCSLRVWAERHRSDRAAIMAMFVVVAEALSAAHQAGVVHRDFKPDNVMVGADGRARVLDFGLAQAIAPSEVSTDSQLGEVAGDHPARLTMTGTVLGTPAYMAPEQFRGIVDARTDQYAWCVALFEALAGTRPFEGATAEEIRRKARRGRVAWSAVVPPLPRSTSDVLARGLDPDPERRFPSMAALLAALRARPPTLRILGIALGIGALAVGAASWPPAVTEPCDGLPTTAALLDPQARAAATAAFATSDPAGTRWRVVEATLDARVQRWGELWSEACAPRVEGRDVAAHGGTIACLVRHREQLEALLDRFVHADAAIVRNAQRALLGLGTADVCRDRPDATTPSAPPEVAEMVAAARASIELGGFEEALAVGREAWQLAHDADAPLAEAEALAVIGAARVRLVDPEGQRTLEDALWLAHEFGDDERVARVATDLIYVTGYARRDLAAAEQWAEVSAAAIGRLGDPMDLVAGHHANLGAAMHVNGRNDRARVHYALALAFGYVALGRDHPRLPMVEINLAALDRVEGRAAEAIERLESLLARQQPLLGTHPEVATILANLATARLSVGQAERAVTELEEAIAIFAKATGPEDLQAAMLSSTLGVALKRLGRRDEAIVQHRRAIALIESIRGPDHPEVARALTNLSDTLFADDQLVPAREALERALVIRQASATEDHLGMAATLRLLGEIARRQDDLPRSRRFFAEAERSLLAVPAAPSVDLAMARLGLAEAELGLGNRAAAEPLAAQARAALVAAGDQQAAIARCDRIVAGR